MLETIPSPVTTTRLMTVSLSLCAEQAERGGAIAEHQVSASPGLPAFLSASLLDVDLVLLTCVRLQAGCSADPNRPTLISVMVKATSPSALMMPSAMPSTSLRLMTRLRLMTYS